MRTTFIFIIIIVLGWISPLNGNSQTTHVEPTTVLSFQPEYKELNTPDILYRTLKVPENPSSPSGNKIELAFIILKAKKNVNKPPILYLEGGPGGSGTEGIWAFIEHPLRAQHDIILVDVRGTGNSKPRLSKTLGNNFLEILATNQTSSKDEIQKVNAIVACKNSLLQQDIHIEYYNSLSIANDLHELKNALKVSSWIIYSASYGTYFAKHYVNQFSEDISALILDSPIPNIDSYYSLNTTNFMTSLKLVFSNCRKDSLCNSKFPNLEKVFYETIQQLNVNPIKVKVNKSLVSTGEFNYNEEDFKIAIQQALYDRSLLRLMPALIYAFHDRNEATLSALIPAFSGLLSLDYGVYYCVTCNEVIPKNSLIDYQIDEAKFPELKHGLSFYKSDFAACQAWNGKEGIVNPKPDSFNSFNKSIYPKLILAGQFDPITPSIYSEALGKSLSNCISVQLNNFGHCPSFSKLGASLVTDFIDNNNFRDTVQLTYSPSLNFTTDVINCSGAVHMAQSLNEMNWLFFTPLLISFIIYIFSIFYFGKQIFKKNQAPWNFWVAIIIVFLTLFFLFIVFQYGFSINQIAQNNMYSLAFGLPAKLRYLHPMVWGALFFVGLVCVIFLAFIKKFKDQILILTSLFSLIVLLFYFQYWGFYNF